MINVTNCREVSWVKNIYKAYWKIEIKNKIYQYNDIKVVMTVYLQQIYEVSTVIANTSWWENLFGNSINPFSCTVLHFVYH